MKETDLAQLSQKAGVLEKEILKLEKKGLSLRKKALSLEDRLSRTLSKTVELEKTEVDETKKRNQGREQALQNRISRLKAEQVSHERKREALKQVKVKSSQIRVELKRIQDEIRQETAGLYGLDKLKKIATAEQKIEQNVGLPKKPPIKIKPAKKPAKQAKKSTAKPKLPVNPKPVVKSKLPVKPKPVVKPKLPVNPKFPVKPKLPVKSKLPVKPKPLPKKIAPPKPSEPTHGAPAKQPLKPKPGVGKKPFGSLGENNPFSGMPVRKPVTKEPEKPAKTVEIKRQVLDIRRVPKPLKKPVPQPSSRPLKKPVAETPFGLESGASTHLESASEKSFGSKPGQEKQNPLYDPSIVQKNKQKLNQDFSLSKEAEQKIKPGAPKGVPIKKPDADLETLEELEASLASKKAGQKPVLKQSPQPLLKPMPKPAQQKPMPKPARPKPVPKSMEQKPMPKPARQKPSGIQLKNDSGASDEETPKPFIPKPFKESKSPSELNIISKESLFAEDKLVPFSRPPISLQVPVWPEPKEKQANSIKGGQKGDFVFSVSVEKSGGKPVEDLVSEKVSRIESDSGSKVIERKETVGHVFLVYTTSKGYGKILHKGMFISHNGSIYSVFFSAPEEKFKEINDTFWACVKSIRFG